MDSSIGNGLVGLFIAALIVAAFIGWCLIEGIIYLCKHIHISWS